jgi:hypothetical protein
VIDSLSREAKKRAKDFCCAELSDYRVATRGTEHVALAVAELPALSIAAAVRAKARPALLDNRSARSTVNPPEPLGRITTGGGLELDDGSFLVILTAKEPGRSPDTGSAAVTVAT